jgi:hypothetical protein
MAKIMERLNWFLEIQCLLTPVKEVFRTTDQHSTGNYYEAETEECMGKRETVLAVITDFNSYSTFNITWTSEHTDPD